VKYEYIDNIRGIAILMVIFVHSSQEIVDLNWFLGACSKYGQMGVQLFFIASAFTLCLSWDSKRPESFFLISFYIRRIFRIAPLYYIGILIYFLINSVLETNSTSNYTVVNLLANILFFHGGYQPANNNIVPGGWSIGTEMLFYFIFPMCFRLFNSFHVNGKAYLIPLAGVVVAQLYAIFLYMGSGEIIKNNSFSYFNILIQFQVFCLGMYLFFSEKKWSLKVNLSGFFVFTLIAFTMWFLVLYFKVNLLTSFVPLISGISFLFLFTAYKLGQIPSNQFLKKIGKLSFGMYVTHFIFAWYIPEYFLVPVLGNHLSAELLFITIFFTTTVSAYYLSLVLFIYVEKPIIELGKKATHYLGELGNS